MFSCFPVVQFKAITFRKAVEDCDPPEEKLVQNQIENDMLTRFTIFVFITETSFVCMEICATVWKLTRRGGSIFLN